MAGPRILVNLILLMSPMSFLAGLGSRAPEEDDDDDDDDHLLGF